MGVTVAVVSACYGAYDQPRAQCEQDIAVDWIYVSDAPPPAPEPWETWFIPSDEPPCLAAKRAKCEPWSLLDYEHIIWLDANSEVTNPAFAREALACLNDGVAVFAHPRRDCIYDEADASLGAEGQGGKYADEPIREQVAHYRAEGHPAHAALYACGTVVWDATDDRARALGAAWIAECEQWSIQDQLSLPVVARRLGVRPGVFRFPQIERRWRGPGYLGNRWLQIHPHAAAPLCAREVA